VFWFGEAESINKSTKRLQVEPSAGNSREHRSPIAVNE
jgi:hypothetical protein